MINEKERNLQNANYNSKESIIDRLNIYNLIENVKMFDLISNLKLTSNS